MFSSFIENMKKLFILVIAWFLLENSVSEIRLTDPLGVTSGSSPVNGYAEVFNNGIWSPICADSWQQTGSQVLCRMLGYNTSSHSIHSSYTACIYNISCTGTERSLEECTGGIGYQYYAFSDVAYVRCGSGNKTSTDMNPTGLGVRLVGGANPYEGKVELFALNQWMSVYSPNNTWSDKEAAVVCRTLGFSTIGSTSFKVNLLNNVQCNGQEKSLDQCVYNTVDCKRGNIVYLRCGCIVSGCSGSGYYCDIIRNTCVTACSPGSYASGSVCWPCSVGTYQPLQHQWYYCSQCPAGTYQNRTGQTVCIACPSGSYQAKAGQTSCDICLPGTYQNQIGQSSCNPCPAGTYQYRSGQTSCLACDLGTYQNFSGQVVCLQCGKEKTTDRSGIDSYSDCHDGKAKCDVDSKIFASVYDHPAEQDDSIGQPHMNLVIMGGSLMIGIAFVNIIVCIVVLKRTRLKTGKPTTWMSKLSLRVRRRNEYVSENPVRDETANSANSEALQTDTTGEEQYEVCERH